MSRLRELLKQKKIESLNIAASKKTIPEKPFVEEPIASKEEILEKSPALEDSKGDYLIMKTEGADIASFYLKDCTYKKFNARKGATTTLTEEGDYVYVYEKKTVTKVATK